jgi:hypothetical protein
MKEINIMKKILLSTTLFAASLFGADVTLNLTTGWNLVGLPFDSSYDDVKNDKISTIWSYSGGWASNDKASFNAGYGFWVKTSEASSLPLSGDLAASRASELVYGWNLLTPLSESESSDDYIAGNTTNVIWTFASGAWAKSIVGASSTLTRGQGFWFKKTEAQTVTVDAEPDAQLLETVNKDQAEISIPNPPASDISYSVKSKKTFLGKLTVGGVTGNVNREETALKLDKYGITINTSVDTITNDNGDVEALSFPPSIPSE